MPLGPTFQPTAPFCTDDPREKHWLQNPGKNLAQQLFAGPSSSPLPKGWPTRLDSDLVWGGADFRDEGQYTHVLTAPEKQEIDAALRYFKSLGLDGHEVNRGNFPLPSLRDRLRALTLELHRGKGFLVLRGLNPSDYSPEDNIVLFLGISSYVGEKTGKQDDKGNMFAHIREGKWMLAPQQDRPVRDSNVASTFHNDMFCDILAMQTRNLAAKGGNHALASAWKIYNELAATRPDIVCTLASPDWAFDTRGRLAQPHPRPLLYYHNGRIILNFARQALLGVPDILRSAGLPALRPGQIEALDAIEAIAQKHQLRLAMRPGDLTFVNNFGLVHSREAFEDAGVNTRYLVRMWLKNDQGMAWGLPPELEWGNRKIFEEDAAVSENWNVVYKPRIMWEVPERFSP